MKRAFIGALLSLFAMAVLSQNGFAKEIAVEGEKAPVPTEQPADVPRAGSILKAPVFILQPGAVTGGAISAPGPSSTDFVARFVTLLPTDFSWLNLVSGLAFTPFADNAGNRPVWFYGLVMPITPLTEATNGWFTVIIDPLGVYAEDPKGGYKTNFVLEIGALLTIGKLFPAQAGPLSKASLYVLADNRLTNTPDKFAPTLIYGLSIPVAPWN